jgi:hypothetical protein
VKKLPARRLALTLLAVVLAAGAVLASASLAWRLRPASPPRLDAVAHGEGSLSAGAAEIRLEVPAGAPIAGFPRWRYASEGIRDPVGVRALVLSERGCTVALVSADVLLVPGALARAARERVADLRLDGLVIGATHTHAGPGGYWADPLGQRFATGGYDPVTVARLADAIATAVRRAAAALRPAGVAFASTRAADLVWNRDRGRVDGTLAALRIVGEGGAPIAEVIVFPAHATLLGGGNRLISGDWPARLAEPSRGVRLYFQGAVGDQSARPPPGGGADAFGDAVRERLDGLGFAAPDPRPSLSFAEASADLPAPTPGAAPAVLRRAAATLLLRGAPATARVAAIRIGPALLLAVPAEPVAEVGARWRASATHAPAAAGGGPVMVVSLAGDYLGYVETPERMASGEGETPRTYYGPELAERLGAALSAAAAAVSPGS